MTGTKKLLTSLFFLVLAQNLINPTFFVSHAVDFLDRKNTQGRSHLGWDTKIPVGLIGNTAHYLTLPMGMPLIAIPLKISQKREELGLSADISPHEQSGFFQNVPWETAKAIFIKSPIPGYVVHMNVRQGQRIMAGDSVYTLESMKMHINISAGTHGEIRDIFFQAGDTVDNQSNLISLLPTSPNWENIEQEKIMENRDFLMSLFPWAAKIAFKPSKTPSSNREWENRRTSTIFDNADHPVLLWPWRAEFPLKPSNNPLPHKGSRSNILTASPINAPGQQMLTLSEFFSSAMQNLIINHFDRSHKLGMGNTRTTSEMEEKQPSMGQREKAYISYQAVQKDEFKNTSGISTFSWVQWLCGLVILSKLASLLQSLSYNLWRRIGFNIISAFPTTAYLCVSNCNNYVIIKNITAYNRNCRYFVKWRIAS